MNLLSLLRRVTPPVPPRADPVDPPVVDRVRAFAEAAVAVPAWGIPDRLRWEQPDLAEEDVLLDEVGEAPETAGAGLYGTEAGEAAVSVPR